MNNVDLDDARINVFLKGDSTICALAESEHAAILNEYATAGAEVKGYIGIYGDILYIRGRDIQALNFWSREAGDRLKEMEKLKKDRETFSG